MNGIFQIVVAKRYGRKRDCFFFCVSSSSSCGPLQSLSWEPFFFFFFLGLLKGSLRKKGGTIVLLLVSILLLFPYTYSVVLIVAFTASQQKVSVDRDAFKSYTKPLERTSDYFDLCRISEYHMCIAAEDWGFAWKLNFHSVVPLVLILGFANKVHIWALKI